jgi:hypothetical protein
MLFKDEADNCRREAAAYRGKPEAPFLLRVARAFDELDEVAMKKEARRGRARKA